MRKIGQISKKKQEEEEENDELDFDQEIEQAVDTEDKNKEGTSLNINFVMPEKFEFNSLNNNNRN